MSTAGSSPIHQPLVPPPEGVAVRMYRQGLGDCFLLAFATVNAQRPTYVLIDCGVHRSQPGGNDNVRLILNDLAVTTGGQIDILVATHEHTDHLSGFVTGAERITSGELKIGRLWLGWTEDPDHPVAKQLRGKRQTARQALDAVIERAEARRADGTLDEQQAADLEQRLRSALSFSEVDLEGGGLSLDGLASELGANEREKLSISALALRILRQHAQRTEFLRPGSAPLAIPGANAARTYVLGPPEDLALLKKSRPSSGWRQETYLTEATGLVSFASAALAGRASADRGEEQCGEVDQYELCNPFSAEVRIRYEDDAAAKSSFFQKYYGIGDRWHDQAWRQIEGDWLFAAEQLALDLDNHTNNTSVALAFELGPRGRGLVLLFAADAQVGSWLSWCDLSWGEEKVLTVASLFARTALYKVGHHASHNATCKRDGSGRDYGLALMPDGVIALIPVDAAVAAKLPGWHMPDPSLYQVLVRKARNNVLRSDEDRSTGAARLNVPPVQMAAIPGVSGGTWRRSTAAKSGSRDPLFYDIFLEPRDSS